MAEGRGGGDDARHREIQVSSRVINVFEKLCSSSRRHLGDDRRPSGRTTRHVTRTTTTTRRGTEKVDGQH